MKKLILIVAVVALAGLAGCARDSVPKAMEDFCASLQTLDDAAAQFEQLTPDSTVGDVKKARNNVADAWRQVTRSAGNLVEARVDSIEGAVRDLERTVDSVSNRDTVAEAAANISASADQVRIAVADVGSVTCPDLAWERAPQVETTTAPAETPSGAAEEPALPPPPATSGVEGTYTGQLPPSNGSEQTMTLALHPNGEASMVFSAAPAGSSTGLPDDEHTMLGAWTKNADGTVTVTLDRASDGRVMSVAESFTFTRQDGQLVALEYNREVYGQAGLTLQASTQAAVGPTEAQAITGTTGVEPAAVTPEAPVAPAAPAASPEPAGLTGVVWQLQELQQGSAASTTVPDPSQYTLTLADDGVARATADCNVGLGTYQVAGSDISFQIQWQTAGCTQTGLARQFSTYLDYANAFQQQGDALVIYYNNSSGQMRFVAGQ